MELFARMMKSTVKLRRKASLYFNSPEFVVRQFENQVDFRSCRRAIETRPCSLRCTAQQILKDKAFPASAYHRVPQYRFLVVQHQKGVDDSAVAHIQFWRFDQPLFDIGMERHQMPHQKEIGQQTDISRGRLSV